MLPQKPKAKRKPTSAINSLESGERSPKTKRTNVLSINIRKTGDMDNKPAPIKQVHHLMSLSFHPINAAGAPRTMNGVAEAMDAITP